MASKKQYSNAKDVLPAALVNEIQKHFHGLLWIPSPKSFYQEREALVMTLKKQGVRAQEIANLSGVSKRRVYQILGKERNLVKTFLN